MNEKDLGDALLKWDASGASPAPDPRQLTQQVLGRDRRRVRLLAGVASFLWLLAAAVVLWVLYAYYWHFLPKQTVLLRNIGLGQPPSAAELQRIVWLHLRVVQGGVKLLSACVAVVACAALSTVLLVFATRRATLRQVNASLVDISQQLKQLRAALGK